MRESASASEHDVNFQKGSEHDVNFQKGNETRFCHEN